MAIGDTREIEILELFPFLVTGNPLYIKLFIESWQQSPGELG